MRFSTAAAFVLGLAACRPSAAPSPVAPSDAGAFVVLLGRDTVSAEEFSRTGNRITGRVIRRVPRAVSVSYTLDLADDGRPRFLEFRTRLPDGSVLPGGNQSVAARFVGDTVVTELRRDTVARRAVAVASAFPELDGSVLLFALPVNAMRIAGLDSMMHASYAAGAQGGSRRSVVRRGPTLYDVDFFGSPMRVEVDAEGRMQSIDGTRTTFRITARRQGAVDLDAMLRAFAERERIAGPMTALSPNDSALARVGNASITVRYGRPSARGRRIWGPNGVLGDTLWRTGANAATRFVTTSDLLFGSQRLPAGQYTLTTLAIPGRYHLIFTDGTREVLRVPLSAATLNPPVEQFRIAIDPAAAGASRLRLQWDTTELSADFQVP